MSKRTVTVFAVAAIFLVVLIPLWATGKDADTDSAVTAVAPADEAAQTIFHENCGPCHTLKKAGTDGVVGPNLDESGAAASPDSVVSFNEQGAEGRMPAGILRGERAEQVAKFVAKYAGQ